MKEANTQKTEMLAKLKSMLEVKAQALEKVLALAKESRDNETKSSVGDKYETGRAMMQIEIQNNTLHLSKVRMSQDQLSKINLNHHSKAVSFGSLVYTNYGVYFLSIGLGKIEGSDPECYAISLASPLGQLLKGKVVGESVLLNGRNFKILKVD